MATYYRTIKGKKYDRALLDLADEVTAGKGDGRISMADARRILSEVKDADDYTDIEKKTIRYIRDNFKFTRSADEYFRKEIRSWAASRGRLSSKKKASKTTGSKKISRKKTGNKQNAGTTGALAATAGASSLARAGDDEDEQQEGFFSRLTRRRVFWSILLLILFIILILLFMRFCVKSDDTSKESAQNQSQTVSQKESQQAIKPRNQAEEKEVQLANRDLERLTFPFPRNGRSLDVPELQKRLDGVATVLKKNSDWVLEVQGHTCSDGKDEVNQRISGERARAVRQELIKRGIAGKRLRSKGYGDTQPVAPNTSEVNKQKNRRVGFKIL